MSHSLVIIPTFNEIENIEKMVQTVFSLPKEFHILVVDDGSPDGTAEKVLSLKENTPSKLFIMQRKGKQGLGTAYIAGFRWAVEHDYDYIFEMDCDFSHNPQDLIPMQECLENGADVIIGSRYVRGGNVKNWPWDRVLLSYVASLYVRLITWMGVNDTTAGFVGYKRKVLETIDLNKIIFIGYAFQIEMKFASKKCGFKLEEYPITFIDREFGQSKMSKGIIKEAVFGVLKMQFFSFFSSYKAHK